MTNSPADPAPRWTLACAGLSVRRAGRVVVRDVTLTLNDDECLSLVGPNGSGKTTLMLALLGLLPPAGGTVRVNGQDFRRLSARARGRFAAYVPQNLDRVPVFSGWPESYPLSGGPGSVTEKAKPRSATP